VLLVLVLGGLVFGSPSPFVWRYAGRDPLWPKVKEEEIPKLLDKVKSILAKEIGEEALRTEIKVEKEKVTITEGQRFDFMIYGKRVIKVEHNVVYVGKETLKAFKLKGKGWELYIPEVCGNILGIRKEEPKPETPEVKVEVKPPVKEEKPEVKEEEKPELKPPVEEKPEVKEERPEKGVVEEEKIAQNINLNVKVKVDFPTPPPKEEKRIGPKTTNTLLIVGIILLAALLLKHNETNVVVNNSSPSSPNPPDVNTRGFLPLRF
jgi:hypothetical protein